MVNVAEIKGAGRRKSCRKAEKWKTDLISREGNGVKKAIGSTNGIII